MGARGCQSRQPLTESLAEQSSGDIQGVMPCTRQHMSKAGSRSQCLTEQSSRDILGVVSPALKAQASPKATGSRPRGHQMSHWQWGHRGWGVWEDAPISTWAMVM